MIQQAKAQRFLRFGFFMTGLSAVLGVFFILVLPWTAIFLSNRATEKLIKREDESALQYLNLALILNPKLATALYNRGIIYQKRKDFDSAYNNYQAAVLHRYAPAYGQLARLEIIWKQNYTKAVDLATEGLQSEPDYEAQYILFKNLGWAQLKLKKYSQAEVNLKQAISLDPKRGSAYCLLAQVLEFKKPNLGGRDQWNNCLKFGDPNHPDEGVWIETAKSKLS